MSKWRLGGLIWPLVFGGIFLVSPAWGAACPAVLNQFDFNSNGVLDASEIDSIRRARQVGYYGGVRITASDYTAAQNGCTLSTAAAPPATASCSETGDTGIDRYYRGTVTYNGVNYTDYCVSASPGQVKEYYCANNTKTESLQSCLAGETCVNGACVSASAGTPPTPTPTPTPPPTPTPLPPPLPPATPSEIEAVINCTVSEVVFATSGAAQPAVLQCISGQTAGAYEWDARGPAVIDGAKNQIILSLRPFDDGGASINVFLRVYQNADKSGTSDFTTKEITVRRSTTPVEPGAPPAPPPVPSDGGNPAANQKPVINQFTLIEQAASRLQNKDLNFFVDACDPDGDALAARVEFGDGTGDDFVIMNCQAVPRIHKYGRIGSTTATLTVTDGLESATKSINFTVLTSAAPPPAANNPPQIRKWQLAANSATLAGGETIFEYDVCDPDNDGVLIDFNYGDGQVETGIPAACGSGLRAHTYTQAGRFTATLSAQDSRQAKGAQTTAVMITAPAVQGDFQARFSWLPQRPQVNETVYFSAGESKDTLGTITKYEWDFTNDGAFDVTTSSSLTQTAYGASGNYTVRLQITDSRGATTTTTTTQTLTVAGSQSLQTYRDTSQGYGFQYREDPDTDYVDVTNPWPPRVTLDSVSQPFTCASQQQGNLTQKEVKVNNQTYCRREESISAGGYTTITYIYTTTKDNRRVTVNFAARYRWCTDLTGAAKTNCEADQKKFDPNAIADQIVSSLTFSSLSAPPSTQQYQGQLSAGLLARTYSSDRVYHLVKNATGAKLMKHWLPNPAAFLSYGYKWDEIKFVSEFDLNELPRVKLVKLAKSPVIYYLTEGGLKRAIPNENVFRSYGNSFDDVVVINATELNAYPANVLIKLESRPKVYLLENGLKRWIKTTAVFNQRGYRWQDIAPVNQTELNSYPEGAAIE